MGLLSFFSEAEIKQFLGAASANDLIVVPLVQTFGHLEVNTKYNCRYIILCFDRHAL